MLRTTIAYVQRTTDEIILHIDHEKRIHRSHDLKDTRMNICHR